MSWLSKAVSKVTEVVKDVAKPIIALVDYGSSAVGAYGEETQQISQANITAGAVGGAAIIAAPIAAGIGTAALSAAADVAKGALDASLDRSASQPKATPPPPPAVTPAAPQQKTLFDDPTVQVLGLGVGVVLVIAALRGAR